MEINALNESSAQFCMICLDTPSKLYPSSKYDLDTVYESLTGILLGGAMNFSPMFCSECAQRLINCGKFRDKSLRAHRLLSDLHKNNAVLSLQTLSSVNRARWQLTSSIVHKTFEPNHCDLHLTDDTKSIEMINVKTEENDLHEDVLNERVKCETDCDYAKVSNDEVKKEVEIINDEMNGSTDDVNIIKESTNNDIITDKDKIQEQEQFNTKFESQRDQLNTQNCEIADNNKKTDVKFFGDDKDHDIDIDIETNEYVTDKSNVYDKYMNSTNKAKHIKFKTKETVKKNILNKNNPVINSILLDKPNENCTLNNETSSENTIIFNVVKPNDKFKSKTVDIKSRRIPRKRKQTSPGEEISAVKEVVKRGRKKKIKDPPKMTIAVLKRCEELKVFKISERTPEEQLTDLRGKRETEQYKRLRYKCADCCKGFQDENTFKTHMDRHTDKFGVFACPVCRIRVRKLAHVTHHVTKTHKFLFHCTKCDFFTNSKETATKHCKFHEGKTYNCPHCGKVFTRNTTYYSHVRIAHPSQHACALCGFCFISGKGLVLHLKRKHYADDKQELSGPRCEECDIRFAHEAAYEIHMKVSPKHAAPGSRKSNEYATYHGINRPRLKPGEKRPGSDKDKKRIIDCEVCGVRCQSSAQYWCHFRQRHPHSVSVQSRGVMCDQCGKVFQSKYYLLEHIRVHNGETRCGECGKTFQTVLGLRNHADRHHSQGEPRRSDDGPRHQCCHCAYRTGYRANLTRHMQIHLPPDARELHHCKHCDKTLKSKAAMSHHIRHVHQKVPWPQRVRPARPRIKVSKHTDSQ